MKFKFKYKLRWLCGRGVAPKPFWSELISEWGPLLLMLPLWCQLWLQCSLVPRPFPPPVFDRLQYANTGPVPVSPLLLSEFIT